MKETESTVDLERWAALERALDALLDAAPSLRDAMLEEMRDRRPRLHAEVIEALRDHDSADQKALWHQAPQLLAQIQDEASRRPAGDESSAADESEEA